MKESKIEIPGQVLANVFSKREDGVRSIKEWFDQFIVEENFHWEWHWKTDYDIVVVQMWGDDLPVTAATTYWMSQIMDYVNQGSKIRFSVAMEDEQLP